MLKTAWPVKTLGEVATIATGKIDVNSATEDGAYPFFTCSRDVYRIDDAPFEGKAVLVAGNGDLNVKYYEGRFNAYQRTYFLFSRNEAKCHPRYLFWFLENYLDVLRSGASGSTIKYIRLGDLSEASIPVPPLEEQKRIVAFLDSATARVTELTACYEQARTYANNLFASALHEALESNPDWPVKALGEVAVVNPSEPALSEEAPFVPMDAVTAGKRDVQYTQTRGQRSGARACAGDILFARITPCLQNGKVALVQDEIARCGGSTEFIVVRAGPEVLNGYLYQWITSDHIRDEMTALMKGATGRQRLNAEDLALAEIPVPPLEEQKQIVARLDLMWAKTSEMVAAYDVKLQASKDLRQSILETAFVGDL